MAQSNPEDRLLFVRDRALLVGDSSGLRRRAARGELVRVDHGVYATGQNWNEWDSDDRYRAHVFAVAQSRRSDVVLHGYSAAALWRLPIIGPWPAAVHLLTEKAGGGRSHDRIRRHALGFAHAQLTTIDGLRVTGEARTVIELAASAPFMSAVAAADFALHTGLTSRSELVELLEAMGRFRGSARAARVVDFATPLAESVAESASRVTMARCRFPQPELQKSSGGPTASTRSSTTGSMESERSARWTVGRNTKTPGFFAVVPPSRRCGTRNSARTGSDCRATVSADGTGPLPYRRVGDPAAPGDGRAPGLAESSRRIPHTTTRRRKVTVSAPSAGTRAAHDRALAR
jgi:hypothetical protein